MAHCECGCGIDAGVYAATNGKGAVKGEPRRFVHGGHAKRLRKTTHCNRGHLRTPDNTGPRGRCKDCSKVRRAEGRDTWRFTEAGRSSQKFVGMKCRYGLTKERFEEFLAIQGGRCACCSILLDSSIKNLVPHIDHEHVPGESKFSTKHVRGLLCGLCNRGLGQFNDSVEKLKLAVQYLEKTQWKKFTVLSSDTDIKLEVGRILQSQLFLKNEENSMTFAATALQAL